MSACVFSTADLSTFEQLPLFTREEVQVEKSEKRRVRRTRGKSDRAAQHYQASFFFYGEYGEGGESVQI